MTKVLIKQRPLQGVQLATPADAFRFRLGDAMLLAALVPWWARLAAWVLVKVLRRQPPPPPMLTVVAVDHATGKVTLEARP